MGFAGATAAEAQQDGTATRTERRITVAEGPEGKVDLIQVPSGTLPESVRVNSNADILCIDLNDFKIEPALDWIKRRQDFAVKRYGGPACIAVLADASKLTLDDRRRISWDIEPAGARFRPWSDNCHSFGEAFRAFAESIKESYRWPMVVA